MNQGIGCLLVTTIKQSMMWLMIKLNIPKEKMQAEAKRLQDLADQEHQEFELYHAQDKCYVCKKPYHSFDEAAPCPHWLLRPDGVEKSHFNLLFNKYGLFQIMPYLRWLATTERVFGNINNLTEEHGKPLALGITIKYKNYE